MVKKYRITLILTSIITICPMLVGILLWNRLPEQIATHFGNDNTANGWSSKPFAVFGLPLIFLAVHLLCFWATVNDPKRKNINEKFFCWILWIAPAISLICCLPSYGIALGYEIDIGLIACLMLGLLFIIMGNYMHKIKQNYTVGIKLSWTLNSEENWNRTHRMASWLWIICGILMMLNGILKIPYFVFAIILIMGVVPVLYSFLLYKKGI